MATDILILGGGFGGVYTAHHLLKKLGKDEANVTLINKENYCLFMPLIHEVATGNIRVNNVVEPIRDILESDNFEFHKATVEEIDLEKEEVKTNRGTFNYDYVVNALGSQTNFYGIDGSEHCYTLKSLHDAYKIRNRIIDVFEEACLASKKKREELLTLAIVGGGPTGVELSCEIADFIFDNLIDHYPHIKREDVDLKLVHPMEKVLPGIDEKLREQAMEVMKKKNVQLEMNQLATKVTKTKLKVKKEEEELSIPSRTVIWTAGVKPVTIPVKGVDKVKGRIPVGQDLTTDGYDNAFALGDVAAYSNPDGSHPPPTAQLASQQAKAVANNLARAVRNESYEDFVYNSKGFLASLGKWNAIAKVKGIRFYGFPAWFVWRTIYLSKLIGFENKLRVMIDWTFDFFFPRDTSQV